MPGITDLSIVNSNTAKTTPVESGTEATLCSPELCGSKNLAVYKRTISQGKKFDLQAGNNYHLVYVMKPAKGSIRYKNETHESEEGAGVLLVSALASLLPALRIARLDPAQTLRHQ